MKVQMPYPENKVHMLYFSFKFPQNYSVTLNTDFLFGWELKYHYNSIILFLLSPKSLTLM
jgi:hypothetical protein